MGGGPYRVVREGVEVQAVADLYTRKRLTSEQIRIVRRQIDALHKELADLLVEEKRILDALAEAASC